MYVKAKVLDNKHEEDFRQLYGEQIRDPFSHLRFLGLMLVSSSSSLHWRSVLAQCSIFRPLVSKIFSNMYVVHRLSNDKGDPEFKTSMGCFIVLFWWSGLFEVTRLVENDDVFLEFATS